MKSPKKRTPAKKQKPQRPNMEDTITITGGSGTDTLTVSDTVILDLGAYGAAQPALTSAGLPTISLDDLVSTSITLPSSTVSGGGGGGGSGVPYYSITTGGTGGSFTTSTGYTWATPYQNTVTIDTDGLTMKEGADIKIGDKSLTEAIEKIEERLGILNPNPELEERWDKLKELRKQYIEMEKDLLEKEKIMKILKET